MECETEFKPSYVDVTEDVNSVFYGVRNNYLDGWDMSKEDTMENLLGVKCQYVLKNGRSVYGQITKVGSCERASIVMVYVKSSNTGKTKVLEATLCSGPPNLGIVLTDVVDIKYLD